MERFHPIGTPGEPWGDAERRQWFETQAVQRSYADEVLAKIDLLGGECEVIDYGALPTDPERYPLKAVCVASDDPAAPWVLVTGGVHGYETSGVQGALAVVAEEAGRYRQHCNLVVAPCVSPWGYEVIHRWNPGAHDPNRSFHADSPSPEAAALMTFVESLDVDFVVHMDLHETTDSDEDEFRPALAARDGVAHEPGLIPDGFYTVGDTENPQPGFQQAIIESVAEVTHIAPADENGEIIGEDVTQPGVINYPIAKLSLCAGMTGATFTTTTEVYPDSPTATPEICIAAQLAAVRGGLDHALAQL
ncbi:MAG: M14 family metallocarboxypeptidase [Actinomycetota bacterium]